MVALIPIIIIVGLIAFWFLMLQDMLTNDDIPSYSPRFFAWPPLSRNQWLLAFLVFNVAAAGYYYFTIYREE